MSFSPAGIPSANFIGTPYSVVSKLGDRLKQRPRVVPLLFNWQLYGVSNTNPNIQVPVNLAVNTQSAMLEAIRSVYIDNTGSDGSVYVYFPDTGCIVTCAPFATNYQPVFTNLLRCVVIGKGFITGDTSQTTVFLTNETLPPGESIELGFVYPQYRASPRISRGQNQYSTGFNSPALGDQWQYINAAAGTNSTPLFGSPYAQGGYITFTDLHVDGLSAGTWNIKSTGASGTFFSGANAVTFDGMQVKLNAAETWQFNAVGTTGIINAIVMFSYSGSGIAEVLFNFSNLSSPKQASPINFGPPFANVFCGTQFTAPQSGSVLSNTVNISNAGGVALSCALYTDNAGSPGMLLATSNPATPSTGPNEPLLEFDFPTPLPQIVSGTKYWLVIPAAAAVGTNYSMDATSSAVSPFNGSGLSTTTIAALAINSGGMSGTFLNGVNCQQP